MGIDTEVWRARVGLFNGGRQGSRRSNTFSNFRFYLQRKYQRTKQKDCNVDPKTTSYRTGKASKSFDKASLDPPQQENKNTNGCLKVESPRLDNQNDINIRTSHNQSGTKSSVANFVSRLLSVERVAVFLLLLLIMAGDVELNPGPQDSKKCTKVQSLSLDDLIEKFHLKEEFLATEVSQQYLVKISRSLDCWKLFARTAGFNEAEVSAIERDGRDENDRRYKTLDKWHMKNAFLATFKLLIEILLEAGRANIAQEVCRMQDSVTHDKTGVVPPPAPTLTSTHTDGHKEEALYSDAISARKRSPQTQSEEGPVKKSNPNSTPTELYRTYLNGVYSVKQLPADEKYPLDCVKDYINLECTDARKRVTKKEAKEFGRHCARGDIESICRERITIDQVATKQDDCFRKLILVKGAPGVGKTTFSWELCRRWSAGKLLDDYSLVVLLRLRDENVQRAEKISDLFRCGDCKLSSSVYDEVKLTQGKGVLFILEGLDELPQSIRENNSSIFTKLINGQLLPASTVLVTSRPWAISDCRNFKARIDQSIDILGFTKEQISEFIDHMIKDGEPEGLRTYVNTNPHISSAMYNPLHARIVVEVYREYSEASKSVFPNTTTELYTAYSTVIIQRYLADNPAIQEWNGDLNSLPASIETHFNDLCKIAHDGIAKKQTQLFVEEEQQLVFFKEDVPKDFNHLGFMNSVQPLHRSVTNKASPSFNFLHFTLQEYLAAVYIWKNLTPHQQLVLFVSKEKTGTYKMILVFLAGLTKFEDEFTRRALPSVPLIDNVSRNGMEGKVCNFSIGHIQWLYESQNNQLIASYGNVLTQFYLSGPRFNPQMFFALGYCIAASAFQLDLTLYYDLQPVHLDMLTAGAKKCIQPSSAKLKALHWFGVNIHLLPQLSDIVSFDLEYLEMNLLLVCEAQLPKCFLDNLQMSTNLKHVKLSGKFHRTNVRLVLDVLKNKSSLEKLEIEVTSPSVCVMLSDFITHSSMKTLSLKIPVHPVVLMFQFNVDKLKKHHNGVEPLLPSYIFELDEESFGYVARKIGSDHWQFPVSTISKIRNVLEYFKNSLEVFSIMDPNLNEYLVYENLETIFTSISTCTALRELHLPEMGSQSSKLATDARLTIPLSEHKYLQTLCVDGGDSFTLTNIFTALKQNSSIRTLVIIKTTVFKTTQVEEFVAMITTNTTLQQIEIMFGWTRIGDNIDLRPVLDALKTITNMIKLRFISHSPNSDVDYAPSIASLLETNKTLEYLEIPHPRRHVSCVPIFKALSKNTTMKTFKLHTDRLTKFSHSSEEITALTDMLVTNKTLQVLHLWNNPDIDECHSWSQVLKALAINKTLLELGVTDDFKEPVVSCPEYVTNRQRIRFIER